MPESAVIECQGHTQVELHILLGHSWDRGQVRSLPASGALAISRLQQSGQSWCHVALRCCKCVQLYAAAASLCLQTSVLF